MRRRLARGGDGITAALASNSRNTYETVADIKKDINAYIKFYNTQRVTLKMGLKIPA